MVKLASAREARIYGPRASRARSEYINAAVYVFGTVLLLAGSAAELSMEPKSGLVLLLLGFLIVLIFALVEFAVPVVFAVGSVLLFLAVLFLFIQAEKGYGHTKLEKPAMGMLIAGPALWLLGSIQNSCQVYERAGWELQVLQESVILPFSMASLLFLVASIINCRQQLGYDHHGLQLLGETWVWIWIFGSLILFVGALANVVKVFKMQQQQADSQLRLEKLRGGAQERLMQGREATRPMIS